MKKIKINELINIYSKNEIDEFLKKYTGFDLNEDNLTYEKVKKYYKFVGNNPSNASAIDILDKGEYGICERITNGIDSVIEKQKEEKAIIHANKVDDIVKKAFPEYYKNKMNVLKGKAKKSYALDAEGQVILKVNDSGDEKKPDFTIIDQGCGITGSQFERTILTLQSGNKLSSSKSFLIGALGVGGSSSCSHCYATIIISKCTGKLFFTIIKPTFFVDFKNKCYLYTAFDGEISEVDFSEISTDKEEADFINSESGTLVRLIQAEVSRELIQNDINKPAQFGDFLAGQLFNVGLPVQIIDDRKRIKENKCAQRRNVYGSYLKLHSWDYIKTCYSGTVEATINNRPFNINFYSILPSKKEDYSNDSCAKEAFSQFNPSLDQLIFTANGQKVCEFNIFTKLKNNGLNQLRYRLLVVIDLDSLGNEKFRFFTSDRCRLNDIELTRGLIDQVVEKLSHEEKLIELNQIIANLAINRKINVDYIEEITKEVKKDYADFIRGGYTLTKTVLGTRPYAPHVMNFGSSIIKLKLSSQDKYYRDQVINLTIKTEADKQANMDAKIDLLVDDKCFYDYGLTYMNGRIQLNDVNIKSIGIHKVKAIYYKSSIDYIESNEVTFEIQNIDSPASAQKKTVKALDLKIVLDENKDLICDISKNNGAIIATLCLTHNDLLKDVYGSKTLTTDKLSELQNRLIKPLVLNCLFMGDSYNELPDDSLKNKIMISLARTVLASNI